MNITLRLAWRNLWRHSRRTWLTIGAMVFSNALLVFMISLQFGMYELMIENTLKAFTGHLQVQAPGYKDEMKIRQVVPDAAALAARLRRDLETESISTRSSAFALLSSEDRSYGVQLYGVVPGREASISSVPGLVREGRFLEGDAAAEIVVGSVLARNLKVGLGDEVTLLGSGRDGSFAAAIANVVGIFESGVTAMDRSIAEVPFDFFDDVFYMQGAAHSIVVVGPSLSAVEVYRQRVESLLPAGEDLVVHNWDALQPGLKQAIQADMSSAFFMYGLLVILVAFSVMNTQLMSVLERTHEFGIVLSLGLKPGRLARLVLLETTLMGLAGLVLGAVVGGLFTLYFSINGFSYPGMDQLAANFNLPSRFFPQVTLVSLLLGPAVVLLGSILSAIYPALRLHWLKPVEAMRAV
jgi:ABC-type lipoprotein release transport system permease subunit